MLKLKENEGEKAITLIALVLTIIVLLILAGVSIAMLTGENGILTQAQRAKELTEVSSEEEYINLLIVEHKMNNNTYGEELKEVEFNTVDDTTSIYDVETGRTYANGWYYLNPEDVSDYELKNSYIIDYDTGEVVRFDEEKHEVVTNELLCIKDGLVYSADPKNMTGTDSWGDAILHNFNEGDANSGWSGNSLMFDGIDDGIEVKDNSDYSQGITLEIYFTLKGKSTSDEAQILMMKRTNTNNGFFAFLHGGGYYDYGGLYIDIGGKNNRLKTNIIFQENVPIYITYTYDPTKEDEKIDFNKTKRKIVNQVRGLNSWPGAYCIFEGKILKVWDSFITDNYPIGFNGQITAIYKEGIGVKVSNGEVVFRIVQPEGKNKMDAISFVNGLRDKNIVGKVLE